MGGAAILASPAMTAAGRRREDWNFQAVLLTPQNNVTGPGTMPVTLLRQAVYRRKKPSGRCDLCRPQHQRRSPAGNCRAQWRRNLVTRADGGAPR